MSPSAKNSAKQIIHCYYGVYNCLIPAKNQSWTQSQALQTGMKVLERIQYQDQADLEVFLKYPIRGPDSYVQKLIPDQHWLRCAQTNPCNEVRAHNSQSSGICISHMKLRQKLHSKDGFEFVISCKHFTILESSTASEQGLDSTLEEL